jgi:DNA-binding winged helix-turn-helix (wHTH) protein
LVSSAPPGTTLSTVATFPTAAHLEFLPTGGLLRLTWGGREHAIWISDRRCDLLAALLSPAAHAGEFISDNALHARIWPGEPANRLQMNTLVYRLRQTLTSAGVDGPSLIERAPGGGGTRIRLAKDAAVSVN